MLNKYIRRIKNILRLFQKRPIIERQLNTMSIDYAIVTLVIVKYHPLFTHFPGRRTMVFLIGPKEKITPSYEIPFSMPHTKFLAERPHSTLIIQHPYRLKQVCRAYHVQKVILTTFINDIL